MDTNQSIIKTLLNTQIEISRYPEGNEQLLEIHTLIQQYLDEHCQHHIVYDFIDIPPEGGQTIRFCDICRKTFH
jgi:hypothetical protein